MQFVLIDPKSLVFSREQTGDNKVLEYIDRILAIEELSESDIIQLLISDETYELLGRYNGFPDVGIMKEYLEDLGFGNRFQASDVHRAFQRILKNESIERKTGIKDILFEFNKIESVLSKESLSDVFSELVKRMFIFYHLIEKKFGPIIFFSESSNEISVEFVVMDVDPETRLLSLPYEQEQLVKLVKNNEELLNNISFYNIWPLLFEDCCNNKFIVLLELFLEYGRKTKVNSFKFSGMFFEKAKHYGFAHDKTKIKMLMQSLCEVITNERLDKSHHLRGNSSGNSPQIVRNDYKASRHDIDREFHIHYWKKGNVVIFANLVVHNDFHIPNP